MVVEACGDAFAGTDGAAATLPASALAELLADAAANTPTASTARGQTTGEGSALDERDSTELERLRSEVRAARAEADGLREELERARAAAGSDRDAAGGRANGALLEHLDQEFASMRAEIERQRRRIHELESGGGTAGAAEVPPLLARLEEQVAALEAELVGAREAAALRSDGVERLERENARLRDELGALRAQQRPREEQAPREPGVQGGLEALRRAVETGEPDGDEPRLDLPPLEFVLAWSLRLNGRVERAVRPTLPDDPAPDGGARAGDTVQGPGLLRDDLRRLLADGEDDGARRALAERMERLARGLERTLVAERRAAESVVRDLREELSPAALEAREPMTTRLRLVGREGELWRRAERLLTDLTPLALADRLRDRARVEARRLADESEPTRDA
jgi:hypothetical protein